MIRELPWLGVGEEPHSKLYTSGISAPATGPGVFRESARGQAARVLRGRGARSGARAPRLPAPGGPASGAGRGGSRLGSPRPADPTALPLLAAAPACRARPPPCRARSSSRFRISTTCSRMAAAATASRASPATRSPPGSTWATRESLLWSPSPAGPSRDAPPTRELGRGRQPAQVGGVGAWSLLQSSSRDWAGAGRGPGGGCSRRPPPHGGWRNRSSFRPSAVRPFWGCTEPQGPLGQPRVRHPLGTRPWGRVGTVMFT